MNESLLKADKILRAVYDNSPAMRILVLPDCKVLFRNKTTQRKSHLFFKDEINEGDNLLEYIQDKFDQSNFAAVEHFAESFQLALIGENVVREIPLKFMPDHNVVVWFRLACSPVYFDSDLLGISITVSDINEKKKRELFIKEQNRILKEIIYTQSHEVRQPLTNILALISLVEKSSLSAYNAETLELLNLSARQLDNIVKKVVEKADNWRKAGEQKDMIDDIP